MEDLLVGLIAATATLSVLTALTVQLIVKPSFPPEALDAWWHDLAINVATLAVALVLSYIGAFILAQLGSGQLIARAGLQGLIAAIGATFGYEVWKNGRAAVGQA